MNPVSLTFGVDVPASPAGPALAYYADFVDRVAAAGFTHMWAGDHLLWRRPRLELFALLASLATLPASRDLTLGTGIALAPLRNATWLAKSAATLDVLTGGRFILGVGVGGENEAEFEAAGVKVGRRGKSADEAIDACRLAWSGGVDGFSPTPVHGTIPIWVGGRTDAAAQRAAERGDGWLALFLTEEKFAERARQILAARDTAGRTGAFTSAITVWVAVDAEAAKARANAQATINAEYGMEPSRFDRYLVTGTEADVADRLSRYAEAGADHIAIHFAHPDPAAQVSRFAEVIGHMTRT